MSKSELLPPLPMDVINEFRDSLDDGREMAEREIARLDRDTTNKDAINALFRALHNIKGNARMCMFDRLAYYGHRIENIIGEVRSGRLPYILEVGEVVLLALDEFCLYVDQLADTGHLDEAPVREIEAALSSVSTATPALLGTCARAAIIRFTGKLPAAHVSEAVTPQPKAQADTQSGDLACFRDLALRLCARLPYAAGRIERTLPLLLKLNAAAPRPVDVVQLEAALYMHDIGLAFVPDSLLCKDSKYTAQEWAVIKQHPGIAAALLERMPGWEEAAQIVAQHHAWSDGSEGYPLFIDPESLHAGAQMLALVDSYESMTLPRPDRQFRRSVLRAVMEIHNLAGRQFSAELAPVFIAIVRDMVKAQPA
ncbi:MAG: Hpt domain-containing protein [Gammaproteobacteria bacterium]|nr:Hpt domain-containing protein [Gammaproteobacteria bacterium]